MVITIDQMLDEPIYLQLRSQIISAIARGELQRGDALPSVRNLASDLGINLHTVNKAYAVLRDEGYVVMRGRSGAFIADYPSNATASRREEGLARISDALEKLALEYRAQGGDQRGFAALASDAAARVFLNRPAGGDRSTTAQETLDATSTPASKATRRHAEGATR